MRFLEANEIPKRKGKPQPNPLEDHEPFLRARAMIMAGRMKPFQEIGIGFGPEDEKTLGMKAPWRSATDRLKKLVRDADMSSDYQIVKYATDTPGEWVVKVRYEPPMTAGTGAEQSAPPRRGRPKKTP